MQDILLCYKVLDLAPGASAELVRRSYLELCYVWDPERYENNPILRERARQKRAEIEEAYHVLRGFLPELQADGETKKSDRPTRDFAELSVKTPVESSRAILGIIVGILLLFVFAWAFYILVQGRHATPVSMPLE